MAKRELNIEELDTLGETMEEFAKALAARNRSPRTIQSYSEAVNLLERWLATNGRPNTIGDVGTADIECFVTHQLDRHKASSAANRYRSLRAFFRWCVNTGRLAKSPMDGMQSPANEPPRIEVVAADVMTALLGACSGKTFEDYRDTAILLLMYDTGARLSEIANLAVDSIDHNARTVLVLGKGSRFRVVPYGDRTTRALRLYLRARERQNLKPAAEAALWIGQGGGALTNSGITQLLRRRGDQAELPRMHPHMFRHTAAAQQKGAGAQTGEMMSLFGWKSESMVYRYGAAVQEQQAIDAYRLRGSPADKL